MKRTLEDAFTAGFEAGFSTTGEGWNGEYPVNAQTESEFTEALESAWKLFKEKK